jgi:hypothetical protein
MKWLDEEVKAYSRVMSLTPEYARQEIARIEALGQQRLLGKIRDQTKPASLLAFNSLTDTEKADINELRLGLALAGNKDLASLLNNRRQTEVFNVTSSSQVTTQA